MTEPASSALAPKILVVDDDEESRLLARDALENEGYRVVTADDGEAAVTTFAAERPDCVLLDVRMPRLDGFGACRRIRQLPGGADTPVIFLTALRDVDTFDRAIEVGGADFLGKPIRLAELAVRVQVQLRLRRMDAERREVVEEMRRQRDELMRLQLQKEQLMAFIVHDLKNPINSVDLSAQLLLRDENLPERARETAGTIRQEARHLLRLVLNLLDISKAEEGRLVANVAEVALAPVVQDAFATVEATALSAEVALIARVEPPGLTARLDRELFVRVLENLVDNAVRHAPRGSAVRIEADAAAGCIEVRVIDAGRGIPAELRDRIFEKYVQVGTGQNVTRSGRGLGLAFCRLAVAAHGGTIRIEDRSPGAAFCARIPA